MSAVTNVIPLTRVARMRKNVQHLNDAGLYKTHAYRIVGGSLRSTVGEPVQIRRAKAIASLLDTTAIHIFPDEPIVGSMVGLWELITDLPSYEEQKNTAIAAIEDYLRKKSVHKTEQKQ